LSAEDRARLERVLVEGERSTGAQVVVAIFPSLEGESLEDFSIRLAEKWRIGQKGLDDGAIILVFLQDRKMRIEVGYGLEGAIPDIEAARIIREVIAPRFREGRYAVGLEEAVVALYERVGAAEGRGGAPARRGARGMSPWTLGLLALFGVIAVILLREASSEQRFVSRHGYTGSGRGWSAPIPPIWWGGGSWRGGGSGGGFSGGGGSFGGGGASGSW
jgi:uncharacterized protein